MADLTTLSYRNATTLVMLPCHAVYKGHGDGMKDTDWYMESFQKEGHDHHSWVKQIQKCVDLVDQDEQKETIAIISGGKTKRVAGNISESFSYLNLLLQNKERFLQNSVSGNKRIETEDIIGSVYLEEFAKDSFENLLYSVCRFKEITNSYPEKTIIVGYNFKKNRFLNLHAKAIDKKYYGQIEYVGIDPTPPYEKESKEYKRFFDNIDRSEYKNALSLFEKDPYGLNSPLLDKKKKRNPFNTVAPYIVTSEELIKSVCYD